MVSTSVIEFNKNIIQYNITNSMYVCYVVISMPKENCKNTLPQEMWLVTTEKEWKAEVFLTFLEKSVNKQS